jgi:organic radical activating enzyme
MKARIAELFDSMQGEGLYLGEKQIFVRFFGCNLSCSFCDTRLSHFKEYEPAELFDIIKSFGNKFHSVAFTGGEPLLQVEFLKEVLKLTHGARYKNYLESNGTLFAELKELIDLVDVVAMDFKLPSSTGMNSLWWMHKEFLKIACAKEVFVKAVICESTADADVAMSVNLIKAVNPSTVLILQPNSSENSVSLWQKIERFKGICFNEGVTVCTIPQMHKIVGVK